jgi:fatty-acyl-CoA synthase
MRTIGDWIRLNYRRNPQKEALVGDGGRLTYAELAERSWRLARGLRDNGVRPGDSVGVLAGNSILNAEMFFSVAASGGVYVAYNWRWAPSELAAGILETGAKVILVEERFEELLDRALVLLSNQTEKLPKIIREGAELDALSIGTGPIDEVVTPSSPLCIIYTGGSTGTPKGVVLSHSAATTNAINEMYDCKVGTRPNERGLIVTPLFHAAALLCWLVPHFIAGATSVISSRFDEESMVDWVARERITNSFMIPNMMRRLMESGVFREPEFTNGFKALHTGAGLLRMPDKLAFAEILPNAELYFRYGLTEGGPMVTRLLPEDMLDVSVDGSIGTEYLLSEAEIMDPEGRILPPGELGEICVRGPGVMMGYYGRPDETAETLRGGWLHTGDLAVRDDRGYLFFRDRLKDMIKSGGENVYAAEIEQILYLHPAVLEAAVVGVANLEWGEEVRAAIVLRSGMNASESDLQDFVRTRLAGYKVPKQMVFLGADGLPRSAAGKLVKGQLKKELGWIS